jgi:DNA-binding protein H-NS
MSEQILTAAAEMAEARARLEEAEAGIRAAMGRALAAVREAVDDMIRQSGFSRSEVLGISEGPAPEKAKAKRARKASDSRGWALAADPGKVYVRGKMPGWLTTAMAAAGMDPELPADRLAFRTSHMVAMG